VQGVTATANLQQRTPDGRFLATSQVTRHWLGYHEANDLPDGGQEWISLQWLQDQQAPPYRAMQTEEGGAEGLMCAIAAMDIGGAGFVPSCASPYLLQTLLREEWGSAAFVQGDCCGSIVEMVTSHHFYPNLTAAVAGAIAAGTQASYDGDAPAIQAALADALQTGAVSEAQLNAAVARLLETRFRLGEFDTSNAANPFAAPPDPSLLDGPAHRALAREAAAAGVVLLENGGGLLPLSAAALAGGSVAVIGPWADCAQTDNGYGCSPCYSHSYSGSASRVSTVLSAIQEKLGGLSPPATVTFVEGVQQYALTNDSAQGIAQAVAAAQAADITVIVLGLGCGVEAERLDRLNVSLPPVQQQLLAALVNATVPPGRFILVLNSAGGVDFDPSPFGAVLQMWYAGEEAGNGLADVMFGCVSPSGRLPLTFYRSPYLQQVNGIADFNMVSNGTGRTYRYLASERNNEQPSQLVAYWFGYGLSYTTFCYSELAALVLSNGSIAVSLTVSNAGAVPSKEVVQLYVQVPRIANLTTPVYSLQAFAVVQLAASVASALAGSLAASARHVLDTRLKITNGSVSAPLRIPEGSSEQVKFLIRPDQLATTLVNGSSTITGGTYTIYVSGHMPADERGGASSNVVNCTVIL
jgi:beta-glucosidase